MDIINFISTFRDFNYCFTNKINSVINTLLNTINNELLKITYIHLYMCTIVIK